MVQEAGTQSYQVQTPGGVIRRNRRALVDLPSTDSDQDSPYNAQNQTANTPELSNADDTVRRSSRTRRPPDRLDLSWSSGR